MNGRFSIFQTAGAIKGMLLRPFRQRVDLVNAVLLLVLILAIAGQWHLILERIDMQSAARTVGEI